MSRRVVVSLVDDLDGSKAVETVRLAMDGKEVELDLSAENAAKLREAVKPYLAAGRRVGRQETAKARIAPDYDRAELRRWAAENGQTVAERGRVPQSIVEAYKAAGGR